MKKFYLLPHVKVDVGAYKEFLELVSKWVEEKKFRQVIFANVYVLMSAKQDVKLQKLLNEADLLLCDGRPLVWLSRLLGETTDHFYGPWMFESLCEQAENREWRVGFLGGRPEGQDFFKNCLKRKFPRLKIVFCESPPQISINELTDNSLVDRIRSAQCDLFFVGLGWPKQEMWSQVNGEQIGVPCFNVGAAFDFLSEVKKSPPSFMVKSGTAWFYRLVTDFRHTWKRYLKYNLKFLGYSLCYLLLKKKN